MFSALINVDFFIIKRKKDHSNNLGQHSERRNEETCATTCARYTA